MSQPTYEDLARQLSDGLNLCVRARALDSHARTADMVAAFPGIDMERSAPQLNAINADAPYETRSLTVPAWVQQQYEHDLAAWERATKAMLSTLPLEALQPKEAGQ